MPLSRSQRRAISKGLKPHMARIGNYPLPCAASGIKTDKCQPLSKDSRRP